MGQSARNQRNERPAPNFFAKNFFLFQSTIMTVPSISITPSTPNVSPVGTPKKKILPPATVKTPGIKRAIGQMMSAVEKNRLLDEVIELKGELNRMKILNEELQADLATVRVDEVIELKGELNRMKILNEELQADLATTR